MDPATQAQVRLQDRRGNSNLEIIRCLAHEVYYLLNPGSPPFAKCCSPCPGGPTYRSLTAAGAEPSPLQHGLVSHQSPPAVPRPLGGVLGRAVGFPVGWVGWEVGLPVRWVGWEVRLPVRCDDRDCEAPGCGTALQYAATLSAPPAAFTRLRKATDFCAALPCAEACP